MQDIADIIHDFVEALIEGHFQQEIHNELQRFLGQARTLHNLRAIENAVLFKLREIERLGFIVPRFTVRVDPSDPTRVLIRGSMNQLIRTGRFYNWRPERVVRSPMWFLWYSNRLHRRGITNPACELGKTDR